MMFYEMAGVMKAKKSLGQNFLVDESVIKRIVDSISASSFDLIIEIGPGMGALTKKIILKDSFYLAYELDKDMCIYLQPYENEKRKILYKDFLQADITSDIKSFSYNEIFIVGNLPYYITSPIIEKIIKEKINLKKMVIMVQKEVADRFLASSNCKDYGYFTLYLRHFFDIKRICEVDKKSFRPVPKVDSTVLELTLKKTEDNLNIDKYRHFLQECFKHKRKTLKNNLKDYNWLQVKKVLDKNNLQENIRAEQLDEEIIKQIFKELV